MQECKGATEPHRRSFAAQQAVALYKGEFMPGFFLSECGEFERWLDVERTAARECASASALAAIVEQEQNLTVAGSPGAQSCAVQIRRTRTERSRA